MPETGTQDEVRDSGTAETALVWDRGVRGFHWLLVATVTGTLATGFLAPRNWLDLHVIVGTLVATLVAFRLVWGFLGSTHARFANFVVSPLTAARHLHDLLRGRTEHHIGHNPIGTMMILGLAALLITACITGAVTLAGIHKEGPLAFATSFAQGRTAREIHEALALTLLAAIAMHLTGVAVESLRTRENLVKAMLTGRKRFPKHGAPVIERSRPWLAASCFGALVGGGSLAIAALAQWPAPGRPLVALDARYAKECSACHTAHHPSLAPAATWRAIMANLADHFGDNAELEKPITDALLAFTTDNSAEHFDTLPANRLRAASPDGSQKITATEGWRRLHRKVAPAAFEMKKVGGKLNCAACHGDAASGRFSPRAIAIPKE